MWATGTRPNGFAAMPTGWLGRLGGRLMALMNARQQREVLAMLGDVRGADVLEVGHGPGVLLGLLARAGAARVVGVDPSKEMRYLATRAHARRIVAGQVRISAGGADATGLPDAAVDVAVSVNNVAIWPDLEAGVAELRRVVRPGGRVMISWHGGEQPSRSQRGFVLRPEQLDRIEKALQGRFGEVTRREGRRCTVFEAHP